MKKESYDHVGYWSEIKLDIIREYVARYSKILSKQRLRHFYIDAFAGAGVHLSRTSNQLIPGSPTNALNIEPPFSGYFFIDMDCDKTDSLKKIVADRKNVHIYEGDCNEILLHEVFPKVRYEDYKRALCLLDPYGLHLNWKVIAKAGAMRSIEIFLNFPVADMNRNVLLRDPKKADPGQVERMNAYWGDDSWRQAAYDKKMNLFGYDEKQGNDEIAKAFRDRLMKVAGFKFVPEPIPMRNSKSAVVYYLFFASQNETGERIAKHIFKKYRDRGVSDG